MNQSIGNITNEHDCSRNTKCIWYFKGFEEVFVILAKVIKIHLNLRPKGIVILRNNDFVCLKRVCYHTLANSLQVDRNNTFIFPVTRCSKSIYRGTILESRGLLVTRTSSLLFYKKLFAHEVVQRVYSKVHYPVIAS